MNDKFKNPDEDEIIEEDLLNVLDTYSEKIRSDKELLDSIVANVLENKQFLDQEDCRYLEMIIRKCIEIDGFRDPIKAPSRILRLHIVLSARKSDVLLKTLIKSWVSLSPGLHEKAAELAAAQSELEVDALTTDKYKEIVEQVASSLAEQGYDINVARIATCYQLGHMFRDASQSSGTNKGEGDSETSLGVDLTLWRKTLQEISPESSIWEQMPDFINAVRAIWEHKAKARKLMVIKEDIVSEFSDELSFFDITALNNWEFSAIDFNIIDDLYASMKILKESLSEYRMLNAKDISKLSEEQLKREHLAELEAHIMETFAAIQGLVFMRQDQEKRTGESSQNMELESEEPADDAPMPDITNELAEPEHDNIKTLESKPEPLHGNMVEKEEKDSHTGEDEKGVIRSGDDPRIAQQPDMTNNLEERQETADEEWHREQSNEHPESSIEENHVSEKKASEDELSKGNNVLSIPEQAGSKEMAAILLENDVTDSKAALIRELVCRLIREDRCGLAYNVSLASNTLQELYPAWLIKLMILGINLRFSTGELAHLIKKEIEEHSEELRSRKNSIQQAGTTFFAAAAILQPALLAPITGATNVLRSLYTRDGMSVFYQYINLIADFGDRLQGIDPGILKKARDKVAWDGEMDILKHDIRLWLNKAKQLNIIYFAGARVWAKWLEPGGMVTELLSPVLDQRKEQAVKVREMVDRLSDIGELRKEINHTDRVILKRRLGEDITARSLDQLIYHVREAIGFSRRWLDLEETSKYLSTSNSYFQTQVQDLRKHLQSIDQSLMSELNSFEAADIYMQTAIKQFRGQTKKIASLFDPDSTFPNDEPRPEHLLNAELLTIPALRLNNEWEPVDRKFNIYQELLKLIARGDISWQNAFSIKCEEEDHEATSRMINFLSHQKTDSVNLAELRDKGEKEIRECRLSLQRDIDATRIVLEKAVASGLFSENERLDVISVINDIENRLASVQYFPTEHQKLDNIRTGIQKKEQQQLHTVRLRLEALHLDKEDANYQRIAKVLADCEISVANEYIDMNARGEKIPEADDVQQDFFRDFFPHKAITLYDFMNKALPVQVIRSVASCKNFSVIDMHLVPPPQAKEAASMLEAWFECKKRRTQIDPALARRILGGIGFNVRNVTFAKNRSQHWLDVSAEVVADRNRCPVAAYGSRANGNYRILCVWDRPIEESLLVDVGETMHGSPVIVFHFGMMTAQKRRDLAKLCHERKRDFLVLDDILMLYLCGVRGDRMPVFFSCTMPFTYIMRLYITRGGIIPPEMFYGRQDEKNEIMNPDGSCFIYGGRQLGKTVLLRDVQKTFNKPAEGLIACWIDLKDEGIGTTRSLDEIWTLITHELKEGHVLPDSLPVHAGFDKVVEHIGNWLNNDPKRRILVLLDEADLFLESDAREVFGRVSKLKGLMDKTNRRFKVVFAGLHNVQRATRVSNNPLAQYGDPICIGPLLDRGQWRDARALIEQPLLSLGFRFENQNLITKILSQTNYYPSLIQLYCDQLLKHLLESFDEVFDPKNSPPYMITLEKIEDAYKSQHLRKEIWQRFTLTLDLDQRYHVIAYAIALYSSGSDNIDNGFSVSWIRDQAITWWPEGFKERANEDTFRTLLDEMVGLGILRVAGENCYSLRSPNVITFMGTEREIENELMKNREVDPEFEASTFRRVLKTGNPTRRFPLTVEQESSLFSMKNGVCIVAGCNASGLNDLDECLLCKVGDEYFIPIRSSSDIAYLDKSMADLSTRTRYGTTVVFVDQQSCWSELWIERALEKLNKLKSKDAFVKVFFAADPLALWNLVSQPEDQLRHLGERGVTLTSLKPWATAAVKQWTNECGITMSPARLKITGYWPELLYRILQKADDNTIESWSKQLTLLEEETSDSCQATTFLRSFGIDNPVNKRILKNLAELGIASNEDLIALMEDMPADVARKKVDDCLRWASILYLISKVGHGGWTIDSLVGKVLEAAEHADEP